MNNVIVFRPREGLESESQVEEFIAWSKGITAYDLPDVRLDWGAWKWEPWFKRSLDFVKLGKNSRSIKFDETKDLLDPKIMGFAKAYVLQQQSVKRTKMIQEIVAVRALEAALLEIMLVADVTRASLHVYDRAGELIRDSYSAALAYRLGGQLEKLSGFIVEKGLSESGDKWINSIKRPNDAHGHQKNKRDAEKKMPSAEALDAIAEIWSAQPTDHRDIFVSSNCALLLSSPGRVGELNLLAVEALTYKDNRDGKPELFINWYGNKGYGFTDKAVPEVWRDFTVESFRRIKEITDEPRKLAKFLEENPDDFPIHANCPKVDQDSLLTPDQVLAAMRVSQGEGTARNRLRKWLGDMIANMNVLPNCRRSREILQEQLDNMYSGRPRKGETKKDVHTLTLRKLNVYLREYWLPPHFPYTDDSKKIKYQHALNCYFEGQLHGEGQGHLKPYSLQHINNSILNSSLSITPGSADKNRNTNIFLRWGYRGEKFSMTTHQFRHYLNTLAAKGQVGEVEIARWSGRLDVSQNKVYNHISDEERVERARGMGLGSQSTSLSTMSSRHEPILLKDVGENEDRVAHYTEHGLCVHDFSVEPCTKFRDCLTCKKHRCIKGDEEKERRIRKLRDGLQRTLKEATRGVIDGAFGADRWVLYGMDKLEKANALIEILEDANVADGAVIVCTDNGYSALQKGLSARGETPQTNASAIKSDTPKAQVELQKLRRLMGH